MILFQPISIAAACVMALSACASAPPAQQALAPATLAPATLDKALPPPAASGMIQPIAAEVAAYGAANTGGGDQYRPKHIHEPDSPRVGGGPAAIRECP